MATTVPQLANLPNKQNKPISLLFIHSAVFLFLMTAIAKLISSSGNSRILALPDPIFIIPFRWMFCIAGIIELAVAYFCLFSRNIALQAGLVVCLSTNFLLYRLGLWLVGWHRPCSCLGNLTDAIHVSPQVADTVMKVVLAYLLIGSYGILFRQWWKTKAEG